MSDWRRTVLLLLAIVMFLCVLVTTFMQGKTAGYLQCHREVMEERSAR